MSEKMPWPYRIALIVIVLGCLLVSFLVGQDIRCIIKGHSLPIEAKTQGNPTQIPSFTDIQQMLVEKGYPIEVDGRIGPETLRTWESELCNQQASRMFKMMAGDKK